MRGRTSGLGTRISSMVGLFILAVVEVHYSDLRLDVFLFLSRDAILREKFFVGPSAVPRLHRHPNVSGVRGVLSNLSQGDEESKEASGVVRLETFSGSS